MVQIQPVDPMHIQQIWPLVVGFLNDGLTVEDDSPEWSQCYNIHHVQGFVTSGMWLLLVAVDENKKIVGAATVSFSSYPMARVAFVTLVGGKFISSKDVFSQLKDILRARGATKVQGFGRPSIVRLWRRIGFEVRTTLVEAKL